MDAITLAVIQSGLNQVCNEMDLAFVRAAFSPVIAEALDRSDGIYHRGGRVGAEEMRGGELIAQGELGLPVFVGTMQFSVEAVIDRVRGKNGQRALPLHQGDVFILNDPYLGGTHLMDVKFVKPFFYQGQLWCWLANTGHWPDTGGMVPGGFSANATEVEQEGLRLPPVKLYKAGVLDEEILSIILSNIRVADQRIGDIKAQAAALTTGEKRLTALLDRYGAAEVDGAIVELKRRAAAQMRAKIATIPDGVYEGEAFVDSDGVVNQPLRIAMTITKSGGSAVNQAKLAFDMSGSSPPCRGPMNSVIATTKSSIYLAVKHVFPEVPLNAGTFAPLEIVEPHDTFLYAKYPRPVSGCAAEVSQRIAEAVFAALARAIPQQLFAAPAGTSGNLGVGGTDPKTGQAYVMYVISGGGYGGSPMGDGLSNGCSTIGISKTTPVEIMEQRYPVLFEEFSLHEGSGGAGEHRGGFGVNYKIRIRRGTAVASMVMDHGRSGPQGAQGGSDGGVNRVRIVRGGATEASSGGLSRASAGASAETSAVTPSYYVPLHLSKDQNIALAAGDVIEVSTPGGGGYGEAAVRSKGQIERDIMRGYYTREEASQRFGVAL